MHSFGMMVNVVDACVKLDSTNGKSVHYVKEYTVLITFGFRTMISPLSSTTNTCMHTLTSFAVSIIMYAFIIIG